MRIVFAAGVLAALPLAFAGDLKVLYTGKLLGYGRACFVEEYVAHQPKDGFYDRRCTTPATTYSTSLKSLLKAEKTAGALLLGAGDHFSLDFGARNAILNPEDAATRRIVGREELYFVDGKGWVWLQEPTNSRPDPKQFAGGQGPYDGSATSRIDGDAVTEFLAEAGYDAVAPGKHDFYFGPERLRQIARLMAQKKMRMLGVNLVIRGERLKPPVELPVGSAKRVPNFDATHPVLNIKLPPFVLPWMRRVRIENAKLNGLQQFERAVLCESADLDFQNCTEGKKAGQTLVSHGSDDFFIPGKTPLRTDVVYHVCLTQAAPAKPYCKAFEVERPFFEYAGRAATPPEPPYLVRDGAVVFGAVALGLEKSIGKLNTQWIDPSGAFELQTVAVDPIEALRQALDYCDAAGECPAGKRKILLAQMPASSAHSINGRLESSAKAIAAYHKVRAAQKAGEVLGALDLEGEPRNLPFALVIAEAEAGHFTPFDPVVYTLGHPPLTVTPRPPYAGTGKVIQLGVHVQTVTFTDSDIRVEAKSAPVAKVATTAFQSSMTNRVATALQQEGLWSTGNAANDFRDLTLAAMRREAKASVALLQRRDIFEAGLRQSVALELGPGTSANDQFMAAIEGILWKGDYLVRRYVKGSALKKVMAQSEVFDKLDEDPYSQADETQRGLVALGIVKDDRTKGWLVDGAAVDDEKMYLIATTDFLAFGDTGYPDLNQPAVGQAQRAGAMSDARAISELMYEVVIGAGKFKPLAPITVKPVRPKAAVVSKTDVREKPVAAEPVDRRNCDEADFIDCLYWKPAPEPPAADLAEQFRNYFKSPPTPAFPGLPASGGSFKNNQTLTQLRPIWKLAVEKANFSINRYRHNQGEQATLTKNFVGVAESGVSTPKSQALGWEWAAELRRERFRSMEFVRLEGVFAQSDIQQASGSFLKSYASNSAVFETGFRRAFEQTLRQRPWIGFLFSGVVSTQQFNPQSLAAALFTAPSDPQAPNYGCTANADGRCAESFYARLSRTTRMAAKAGFRRESRDTWFETGLFGGTVYRPVSYQLGDAPVCNLRAYTLTACLASFAFPAAFQVTPAQTSVAAFGPESGVFFNFNWNMPLTPRSKMKIELTNRGRFYFNHSGDTRFDTRLSNLFTAAFSAPIAGGLTFKPTWTLFHFENKPNTLNRTPGDSNLLVGNTLDLKLNYSFDWRSGQSWKKALKYGNGK